MHWSIVLSTHQASFNAVAYKGDLATNVAQIASFGYDGVELAIRDPKQVDPDYLLQLVADHQLMVPAIGTGQAWGEDKLSLTDSDAAIRREAMDRLESHLPLAQRLGAVIIVGLIRGFGGHPPWMFHFHAHLSRGNGFRPGPRRTLIEETNAKKII